MTEENKHAFEADARALGFDVKAATHKNMSGEPWCEYRDLLTGHRWGGWLSAWERSETLLQQALDALEYHSEQTRPIERTAQAIHALRAHLRPNDRANSPATAPGGTEREMQYRAALVNLRAGMAEAKNPNIVDYIDAVLGAA